MILEYNKPLEIKDSEGNVLYTIDKLTIESELLLDMLLYKMDTAIQEISKKKGIKVEEITTYHIVEHWGVEKTKDVVIELQSNIKELRGKGAIDTLREAYNVALAFYLFKTELKKKSLE